MKLSILLLHYLQDDKTWSFNFNNRIKKSNKSFNIVFTHEEAWWLWRVGTYTLLLFSIFICGQRPSYYKAVNKSRFRHAHMHAGTAGWCHGHSKFILCLRHLFFEMPNQSLLICLNQSDQIYVVSKFHWCKTWFFVWYKFGHTVVEKTMAVIGTPLSTWQFCLLLSDGATLSFTVLSYYFDHLVQYTSLGRLHHTSFHFKQ